MSSNRQGRSKITLYRGWEDTGAYVWSPFVTKVEFRLRLAGVPYHTEAGSPRQAPKGKIPYVEVFNGDSDTPMTLADSTLIIENLVEDGVLNDPNAKISPPEQAYDLALRALLEDKLYFYQSYEKWHQNYYTMRSHALQALSYPMQVIIGFLAHRTTMQTLHGQGTARFSDEEISSFKKRVWENFDALLVASKRKTDATDDPFWIMGGDQASEADAVLFGFIISALVSTASPESRRIVDNLPTTVEYAKRIHERYFPDYAFWE